MRIGIRRFDRTDIPNKIRWINDVRNNEYLHYDIPLEIEKTYKWYEATKDRSDRFDAVIEVDEMPVGLIGLLCIDDKNKKAEYYITIGEHDYKRKGVAYQASLQILEYAFKELKLNKVYLNVDAKNIGACALYEKVGFKCEGVFRQELWFREQFVDRKRYAILHTDYYKHLDEV